MHAHIPIPFSTASFSPAGYILTKMEQPHPQNAPASSEEPKDLTIDRIHSTRNSDEIEGTKAASSPDRNGEYKRKFTGRHIHVIPVLKLHLASYRSWQYKKKIISLGSNIGSGLFIAIGKALHQGGAGNIILGYALCCFLITAVLTTIAEITIAFPTSGNFIDYATRFVDPSIAFAAGFAEWLGTSFFLLFLHSLRCLELTLAGWTGVVAAEATVFAIVVQYWAHETVHKAVFCKL